MRDHLPLVCFIVCDNGPAAHFIEFTQHLVANGKLRVDIYASESVRAKFKDLSLSDEVTLFHFKLGGLTNKQEQSLALEIIKNCFIREAKQIIVDIANEFNIKLHAAFDKLDLMSCNSRFWCYYDNPEQYVPGGYSIRSGEMIKSSRNILFANINLVERESKIFSLPNVQINLKNKNIRGIGYYPIEIAEELHQRRQIERNLLRKKYGWNNIKYLFIYFGGNNQVYYEQAFPIFLSFLSSSIDNQFCKDILFLVHQHPAAKLENRDGLLLQQWLINNRSSQVMLSSLTSDEAQLLADGILYHQTSMAPQFALIGLPVMQVTHQIYEDSLVKHNLCEIATNSIEFSNGLKLLKEKSQSSNFIEHKKLIYDAIGYRFDWVQNLENIILNFE
ncbi:unnamed protein product [Rotaria socialis]|uniref:Uncharacterized protein n=2 Tax=Rotaria socialis TaxID=392032 RepID=A0A821WUP5_9BILA|nr:unnamed protein product [Rotaria socialis]CAF3762315.1 unnamed protein product [Rotaria socialis]CAF4439536.1 unnamed protein product [Rotaria socialis]CAF4928991.1 unnamed protein product [Rotaria socialis]